MKILITDDSVVYRSQIRAALSNFPEVEVCGSVSNGRQAIEFLEKKMVDLVILDLEMPELSGIDTIQEIAKRKINVKVLVFSSFSQKGAEITLEALKLGAWDFVAKPKSLAEKKLPADLIKDTIEEKIQSLLLTKKNKPTKVAEEKYKKIELNQFQPEIIVVGSSTGGPNVLEKIFSQLHASLQMPILIAQHMPAIFTEALAARLARLSGLRVLEAKDNMEIQKNTVYIAPGDYHMVIVGSKTNPKVSLLQTPKVNYVRPAVDPLFSSAAEIYKKNTLGIVLTGMGSDGLNGAKEIKKNGGAICIQNEESCVVFGMPGAIFKENIQDKIMSPEEIVRYLLKKSFTSSIKESA